MRERSGLDAPPPKDASLLTEDELQAIDKRVHEEVDDAAEFAENPEGASVVPYNQVFADYADQAREALRHRG